MRPGRRTLLCLLPSALGALAFPQGSFAQAASQPAPPPAPASLPELVASAKRSVVAVGTFARLRNPAFRFFGTGFVFGDGTRIATCAHVLPAIDPAAREVLAVAVPSGGSASASGTESARVYEVKPTAIDRDSDTAVLQREGPPLPALPLADGPDVRDGTDVVLIGFPIGNALGLFSAAHRGLVAAITPNFTPTASSIGLDAKTVQVMRGRPIQLLQLDATSYPGNSGSPLIDVATGQVVGIVNMGLVKGTREAALSMPTGISYAVPVRYLQALESRR